MVKNEIIDIITHKIDLLRLSATIADEFQSRIDGLQDSVIIFLSNTDKLKTLKKSEINSKIKQINEEIDAIFNKLCDDYNQVQSDIADIENKFLEKLYGVSVLGSLKDIEKNANTDGFTAIQATEKQAADLKYELSGLIRQAWINAVLNKDSEK